MLFLCWMFVDVAETVVALLLLCGVLSFRNIQKLSSMNVNYFEMFVLVISQLCRSCSWGLSWLVAENNDMSFFQLFQYCMGSGLGTIGDFSSEQLLHDPS